MRLELLNAVRSHALGKISKHRANVEVYFANPAGIGEHSDIIEAIEHELSMISMYHDQLEVLDEYFYE